MCFSRSCSGCGNAAEPGCWSGPKGGGPAAWEGPLTSDSRSSCCPGPECPTNPSLLLPVWGGGRACARRLPLSPMNCPTWQVRQPPSPPWSCRTTLSRGSQCLLLLGDRGSCTVCSLLVHCVPTPGLQELLHAAPNPCDPRKRWASPAPSCLLQTPPSLCTGYFFGLTYRFPNGKHP